MGISGQRLVLLGLLDEEACSKPVRPMFSSGQGHKLRLLDHSMSMHIHKKHTHRLLIEKEKKKKKSTHIHIFKKIFGGTSSLQNNKKIQQKYQSSWYHSDFILES